MTTAHKVREIEGGRLVEFRLEPPVEFAQAVMDVYPRLEFVISSHSDMPGWAASETTLFPSDGAGRVLVYDDLHYLPGHVDHEEMVNDFLKGVDDGQP